jgi:hypothetical protein
MQPLLLVSILGKQVVNWPICLLRTSRERQRRCSRIPAICRARGSRLRVI